MTDGRHDDQSTSRKPAKRRDEITLAGARRRMRRADREVTDINQIIDIVRHCDVLHMSYVDAEGLTIVPLNFGFSYELATPKAPPRQP